MAEKKLESPRDFGRMSDEEIVAVIHEDVQRWDRFTGPKVEKFKQFLDAYNAARPSSEGRRQGANLFIPYIYSTVETSLPKILNTLFDSKPIIAYKPVSGEDQDKAENMTALVEFQMRQKMRSASVFYEIFKSALIFGTAVTMQTWRYEEKKRTRRRNERFEVTLEDGNTVMSDEVSAPKVETYVKHDEPQITPIPLETFFFDPAYTTIEESPFCGRRTFIEKWKLEAGQRSGLYSNTAELEQSDTNKYPTLTTEVRGNMRDGGVEVWDYWTDEWHVMVAGGNRVILKEENPYWHGNKPFTKWTCVPMLGEFYGKSMVEPLMDLQAELNTLRNQRIDNISFVLNRMWKVLNGSSLTGKDLVSRPNGIIYVDDMDEVAALDVPDITSSAYRDEEIVKMDMDVTSGVYSYDRGQQAQRKDTATVATLLTSASSERFKLQALMLEEDPLADVGRQLAELNRQFLTEEVALKVVGGMRDGQPKVVSVADIDAEFDVVPAASAIEPAVNKEVRQSQLIQLLNVAKDSRVINVREIVREILKVFDFENIDEVLSVEETFDLDEVPGDTWTPQPDYGDDFGSQAAPQGGSASSGLYPQLGGVGSLGSHLQEEKIL